MPPRASRAPETRLVRSMPVADSILWSPTVGGVHRPAPLMFFAQHTLRKTHDRLASVPHGRGIGLLAGRPYTDSRSGAQFVVIDGALPLPMLAAEDEPIEVLTQGLRSAAAGIEIVGWYRGHSASDPALTPADVDAQTRLFGDRPCVVVVVAPGGEAGAVFRHSSSPAWPVEALPFYEWLAEPASMEGPKPTMLAWRNYHRSEVIVPLAVPVAPAPTTSPAIAAPPVTASGPLAELADRQILLLDAVSDDDDLPPVAPNVRWYRPFVRPAVYAACAIGGAVIVAGLSAIISASSGSSTNAATDRNLLSAPHMTPALVAAVLDRRADTLALALTAFDVRSRMFDARQMTCTGLSRGLAQVEDAWLVYNIARKESLAPFDAPREARDQSLYADVRTVERRFERSGCARP